MAAITQDRFDPIKAFCNVRLQQGVPLVDADVNELDDIRKFEVRAFLKWIVGDGIPEGNDGFRIAINAAAGATNGPTDDFQIQVGTQFTGPPPATPLGQERNGFINRNFGRCIVDGLDIIIQNNTTYKTQPNFAQISNSALPVAPGLFAVYVDVFERLVGPKEDANLIVPPLGTESCARTKREWIIRARPGTLAPVPGDSDYQKDHSYYVLAWINRRVVSGSPAPILASDIVDRREQRLLVPPSTLVPDVLGVTASDYRRGINRPKVVLRDAINSLLGGELPTLPAQPIPSLTEVHSDFPGHAFCFDKNGGACAVWFTSHTNNDPQIFGSRFDPLSPTPGFAATPTALTDRNPASAYSGASAILLPNGELLVTYTKNVTTTTSDAVFKHAADLASLGAVAETSIPTTQNVTNVAAYPVVTGTASGGVIVFFWQTWTTRPVGAGTQQIGTWKVRRRKYDATWTEANASWLDATEVALSPTAGDLSKTRFIGTVGWFHAAAAKDGTVWAAFTTATDNSATPPIRGGIEVVRVLTTPTPAPPPPIAGAPPPPPPPSPATTITTLRFQNNSVSPPATVDAATPFVLVDNSGTIWVFFASAVPNNNAQVIFYQQFAAASATAMGKPVQVPTMPTTLGALFPSAALDRRGGIWLSWMTFSEANGFQSFAARCTPTTNSWGMPYAVTKPNECMATLVGTDSNGMLWVFGWVADALKDSSIPVNGRLSFRRIFTEI